MKFLKWLSQAPERQGVLGAVTDKTLALLRLILAVSALFIVHFDPSEPNHLRTLTHYALATYILYSVVLYLYVRRRTNFSSRIMRGVIWLDVVCYSALITLGASTNSVFFFFYLFAIIAGSSRAGTKFGLTLTLACTALFLALNATFVSELQLDVPRFVRRTTYMAALGSIFAYWGGAEAALRLRLTLLKDLSQIANPRFGIDRTVRQTLRRFLNFYSADYACFVLAVSDHGWKYYGATRNDTSLDSAPMEVGSTPEIPLLRGYEDAIVNFDQRPSLWKRKARCKSLDLLTNSVTELPVEGAANIADALAVRSFIAVPLRYRRVRGRVFVGSTSCSHFTIGDAIFLQQAADQLLPVIENIRIVDQLASHAAQDERNRIARSVHDRVIQPYLGMHLGLKALQRELFPNAGSVANGHAGLGTLSQVLTMIEDGIKELRRYVGDLKHTSGTDTSLIDSIRRLTKQFEGGTGIRVDITDDSCGLKMNDRLAAEVFQMTAEALSNVHRHTRSRTARVRLVMANNSLELMVENDVVGASPGKFRPVSIVERAEALGARSEIFRSDKKTLVKVEVPL
jgi:signal transduction histidine kinase